MSRRSGILAALVVLLSFARVSAMDGAETTFPAPEAETVQLVLFSTTDLVAMRPIIENYQRENPDTTVRYFELLTTEVYNLIRENRTLEGLRPDLIISTAMDMQFKLVNDGYALRHESPETARIPQWANWRNEAFGFTFEPAVIVYNPKVLPPEDIPSTRFDLVRLLREKADAYRGRVVSYDIAKSGAGYLFATQDALQAHTYGRLLESFGRTAIRLANTTGEMLDAIESGEILIGYNLLGSYTRFRILRGAQLAMILPSDYTLVMSRIAFIHRDASHKDAARSFLDYLLSLPGQEVLARESHLYAIRPELDGPTTAAELHRVADGPVRPIRLGTGLLVYLDKLKRHRFLVDWSSTVGSLPVDTN